MGKVLKGAPTKAEASAGVLIMSTIDEIEGALREAGEATTSELCGSTGYSKDCVIRYCKQLVAKGRAQCRKCVRVSSDGRKFRPVLWVAVGESE